MRLICHAPKPKSKSHIEHQYKRNFYTRVPTIQSPFNDELSNSPLFFPNRLTETWHTMNYQHYNLPENDNHRLAKRTKAYKMMKKKGLKKMSHLLYSLLKQALLNLKRRTQWNSKKRVPVTPSGDWKRSDFKKTTQNQESSVL